MFDAFEALFTTFYSRVSAYLLSFNDTSGKDDVFVNFTGTFSVEFVCK